MIWKYFKGSFLVTLMGVILGYFVGYYYSGAHAAAWSAVFIVSVLTVLEVSLSFDNAVVNALVLKKMTPLWRQRFLTWGILIAVFGMRLIFPLLIVGVVAELNPWDALVKAATEPDEYARIMTSVHVHIAGFGGAFLLMVALKYFFDREKDLHWVDVIERPLTKMGKLEAIELGVALIVILAVSRFLSHEDGHHFVISGILGLITFIFVDGVSGLLELSESQIQDLHRASAGLFLYLEVLDASFSFDGVIGAFAITHNLFIIAIGLGSGAMFVRSMTVMLVDKGTLSQYKFLEHGAFYAIGSLALIMFLNTLVHVPEVVTGLIGATFILLALISSIRRA